ncbi:unnamed protein product, partial [Rotaria sordida]
MSSFVWYQFLKVFLMKMNTTDDDDDHVEARNDMITHCRWFYRDNKSILKQIDEFENVYKSTDAIRWYSKQSFVYRLINVALRTENMSVLYLFRYYLKDLCGQLTQNFRQIELYVRDMSFELYRGVRLNTNEVEKLKQSIGQMISANGFLSATWDRQIAEVYAGFAQQLTDKNLVSVIYKINVDLAQARSIIFADVAQYSEHLDEQEVLFDIGSIFTLNSIEFDDKNNCWLISLTTTDKMEEIVDKHVQSKLDSLRYVPTHIVFGEILLE